MTSFDGRSLFRGRTLAALLAIYLVWGSTYLAIRLAITSLPTFSMAGARFLIAGALLYGWGIFRGGKRPEAKTLVPIAVIGALLLVGGNGLVVWAEHRIASGIAALLIATEPLWIAVLVPLVTRGRRPGLRTYAGIAVGLTGVFVLVGVLTGSRNHACRPAASLAGERDRRRAGHRRDRARAARVRGRSRRRHRRGPCLARA